MLLNLALRVHLVLLLLLAMGILGCILIILLEVSQWLSWVPQGYTLRMNVLGFLVEV